MSAVGDEGVSVPVADTRRAKLIAVVAAWGALEPITVVSADARQTYRGLDIGTAKPPGELLARVPHVGLDVVEPGER